jgi:hypothetical protein
MKSIIPGLILLFLFLVSISCKKETLDDMTLSDGMIVFTLDGTDWIISDMVASYSDYRDTGGGEVINIIGSVQVGIDIYKSINISVKDLESITEDEYPFTDNQGTGTIIEINEGKTDSTGIHYRSINPENDETSTGNLNVSVFDRSGDKISGSFSGEIYKASYTHDIPGEWIKTNIKSGRFQNIPVIIGK